MPRAVRVILAAFVAAALLAACGNKGPLVLPDQAPKKHKHAPAPPDNPARGADAAH